MRSSTDFLHFVYCQEKEEVKAMEVEMASANEKKERELTIAKQNAVTHTRKGMQIATPGRMNRKKTPLRTPKRWGL